MTSSVRFAEASNAARAVQAKRRDLRLVELERELLEHRAKSAELACEAETAQRKLGEFRARNAERDRRLGELARVVEDSNTEFAKAADRYTTESRVTAEANDEYWAGLRRAADEIQ